MNDDNKDLLWLKNFYRNTNNLLDIRSLNKEQLSKDCIFVLDTNILLFPFQLGKDNFNKIVEYYTKLINNNRLLVPAQVIREYIKIRGLKISELYNNISLKRNIQFKEFGKCSLLSSSDSYLGILKIEKEILELFEGYKTNIDNLLKEIKQWGINDPISEAYKNIFIEKVIIDIDCDDKILLDEWEYRKANSIPPGYKDKSVGDLIIWNTMIKIGLKMGCNIIFVSGDEKADWMLKSNNEKISPRYELLYEYYIKTNGKHFNIISLSEFLELQKLDKEVISNVKFQEELNRISTNNPLFENLSQNTKNYLLSYIRNNKISDSSISCENVVSCLKSFPSECVMGPVVDFEIRDKYSETDVSYHIPLRPTDDDGSSWWVINALTLNGKKILEELITLADQLKRI